MSDPTSADVPRSGGAVRTMLAIVLLLGLAATGYFLVRHFFLSRASVAPETPATESR